MSGSKVRLNSEEPWLFSDKELLTAKMDAPAASARPTVCPWVSALHPAGTAPGFLKPVQLNETM